MPIHRALDAFFVPQRCVLCRRRANVDLWCDLCVGTVTVASGCCYRCGGLRQAAHACWPNDTPISATTVLYHDSLPLRRTLATAARHGVTAAWQAFGAALAARYLVRETHPTVVCAVPRQTKSRRAYPETQRQVLATTLATELAVEMATLRTNRWRHTAQVNDQGPLRLAGYHAVLVTDMFRTGQAIWDCGQWLMAHGTRTVDVVAVTRQGDHPLGPTLR